MDHINAFIRRQPIKTLLGLFIAWGLLAFINYLLRRFSLDTGTSLWFPISVFSGPTIHLQGLPYIVLFIVLICLSLGRISRLKDYHIWFIGFGLIVLGNLGQGGFDAAFLSPFYESGIQYFHDAIKITSWSEWLRNFNTNQMNLFTHSRTHPPFAVLIHYLFLHATGNNIAAMSIAFAFISSLTVPVMWYSFKVIGVSLEQRNILVILFSVIPAVNIYSAVSLDGLILATSSLFLLGLIIVIRGSDRMATGISLVTIGFVITNLLTYGGVFLLGVGGLLALWETILRKKTRVATALLISLLAMLVIVLIMGWRLGYNHVQGFITALALENPHGFMGFSEPLKYLMTRIVDVSEVALFLSFGCLAVLLNRKLLGSSLADSRDDMATISSVGVIALIAMFLAGAYRTGETARTCLFIYPYLALSFYRVEPTMLKDLVLLAGFQTAGMQLFGGYFW